jgi:KDO2-lipid IV(A) lauroyltransferase
MLVWITRMLARLPLAWLQAIGAWVGRIALSLSSGFRRKSTDNLRLAGLLDEGRLRRTAEQTGRGVAETLFIWFAEPARVEALIRIEGQSVLDAARALGRGVVILTPHIGSFEAAARGVARSGPITVLYKPPRIEAVRRLVETGRKAPDLMPVPASSAGVRGLLRALRRHECIGILPDQVPSDGDGVWAPFFGRPAYTMTLPQRLARLTGAPVLMAHGERLASGGGWVVRFEALEGDASPQAVNRAMEALIRRVPDQYFWGYNRYKDAPRSGAPPADADSPGGSAPSDRDVS